LVGATVSERPGFVLSRLSLPVSWEPLNSAPASEEREREARSNASALGFLLHGVDLGAVQRSGDERLAEALAPLSLKLDLIIDMLGRMAYRNLAVPPVYDIELGVERIAWESPAPLRVGDWLRVKLYFDLKFLEPIVMFACVTSAVADDDSGGCSVQAEFTEMPPETEDALARLAFLAQRRQLAQRLPPAARAIR
jgi:hypothetical protein